MPGEITYPAKGSPTLARQISPFYNISYSKLLCKSSYSSHYTKVVSCKLRDKFLTICIYTLHDIANSAHLNRFSRLSRDVACPSPTTRRYYSALCHTHIHTHTRTLHTHTHTCTHMYAHTQRIHAYTWTLSNTVLVIN